ncbi:MAG: hypothetical protein HY590_07670 [Candidatus Omnitrophica bacterium]|nr:hypothetical protein [Candidatus Omnitrophota bacterium]
MKKVSIALITLSFILFATPGVQALILPQRTMQEMIVEANTIVAGRCTSFHIHPSEEGETLYAIISFRVDEYLKNDLGKEEILLMQIARQPGTDGKQAVGPLSFRIDEEAILFLTEEDNQGFRHVMGLSQGKFSVTSDKKGRKLLLREMEGVRLYNKETGQIAFAGKVPKKIEYDQFRGFVKETLSKIEAKKGEFISASTATSF